MAPHIDGQSPVNKKYFFKTLHLKISVFLILIIGLVYGIYPDRISPPLFDFSVETLDLKNIFRATMGLYAAMAIIWIGGIIKKQLWFTATITNIAFMGGLAAGRVVSLLADGLPSAYLLAGLAGELILACWGLYNIKKYSYIIK